MARKILQTNQHKSVGVEMVIPDMLSLNVAHSMIGHFIKLMKVLCVCDVWFLSYNASGSWHKLV